MNIYPVPIPKDLFHPLANHWLPANKGRVIVCECEGVDYLCLEGVTRYFSIDLASPAYPLRVAATESNPEQQRWLLTAFLQDVVAERCRDLMPRPSLLHQPPQPEILPTMRPPDRV
jgi:hypothetical protein